jgi:hypothetical protein
MCGIWHTIGTGTRPYVLVISRNVGANLLSHGHTSVVSLKKGTEQFFFLPQHTARPSHHLATRKIRCEKEFFLKRKWLSCVVNTQPCDNERADATATMILRQPILFPEARLAPPSSTHNKSSVSPCRVTRKMAQQLKTFQWSVGQCSIVRCTSATTTRTPWTEAIPEFHSL